MLIHIMVSRLSTWTLLYINAAVGLQISNILSGTFPAIKFPRQYDVEGNSCVLLVSLCQAQLIHASYEQLSTQLLQLRAEVTAMRQELAQAKAAIAEPTPLISR